VLTLIMCQVASGSRLHPANRNIISSKINQLLFMLDLDPALDMDQPTILDSITLRARSQALYSPWKLSIRTSILPATAR
ncbi:MAG TPA: hypothetical protein DES72_09850, partial [Gammaproteobacteria bacterium]|nr:hypothetical protein [Gammaproteobacteria bacterium]